MPRHHCYSLSSDAWVNPSLHHEPTHNGCASTPRSGPGALSSARNTPAGRRRDRARLVAIATEAAERTLFAAIERRPLPPPGDAPPSGLLVGPESGFTERELDLLARTPFVRLVSLGPRILRAESAAIAGLARVAASAGDPI
ncbi:MAG: 16S rRNA (uracil(1498)-N(3))-methyltransferase [Acetobacteraceae bacterium]